MEIRETETLKRLKHFIETERRRFEVKSNNLFAQSFAKITKTYRKLLIIEDRYTVASAAFMENSQLLKATIKEGKHPLTPEQEGLREQGWKLSLALELEIDSFYIFAKMVLDRVAHGIELYFGQSTGCSLESHKEMSKCFSVYVKAKNLSMPPARLMELLAILKDDIRDYRDHEIVHAKKPRVLEAIGYSEAGTVKAQGIMSPTDKDKFVTSKPIPELMKIVDEYLCLVIDYIEENATRTKLILIPDPSDASPVSAVDIPV